MAMGSTVQVHGLRDHYWVTCSNCDGLTEFRRSFNCGDPQGYAEDYARVHRWYCFRFNGKGKA